MNISDIQDNVVLILDHTAHAGNIGASARAMRNMGFRHLRLVKPRQFPHQEVLDFAVGATEIIDNIQLFDTVPEAIEDLNFLVATSNRSRGQRNTVWTPRELGERMQEVFSREHTRMGILFGPEPSGLKTEDVERADIICNIPTIGKHGSLNLSQAVMVVCYELMQGLGAGVSFAVDHSRGERPSSDQMERMFAQMQDVLVDIEFIKTQKTRHMMGSIRALFHRASLDQREIAILRGIFNEIQEVRKRDRKAWGVD
ncbi:MAG: RNA methyltransferase [Magnetococcales bacterium]|nr:RNA methyltransferase [Magnetococcales bacterium]